MNEPILKKMEAAPITSAEFFTRSQARLNFDVPPGLVDPNIIPRTGDSGNDRMLEIVPAGVIVFPGSGITGNLADKAKKLGIPVLDYRESLPRT